MIKIYYHTGNLRTELAGSLVCTRPGVSHTHPPCKGLVLADIRPADGSPTITGYIVA